MTTKQTDQIHRLIELLGERSNNPWNPAERALYHLLKKYETRLRPLSERKNYTTAPQPATSSAPLLDCYFCHKPQTEPGGVLFGPPNAEGCCRKVHCCVRCWGNINPTHVCQPAPDIADRVQARFAESPDRQCADCQPVTAIDCQNCYGLPGHPRFNPKAEHVPTFAVEE